MSKGKSFWSMFFGVVFLLAGFCLGIQESFSAEKVIKWKCQSHWPTASSSYKDSLLRLVENIKARTNGRLIIEPLRRSLWCHLQRYSMRSRGA